MLANTKTLLAEARRSGYAVGAFNIYNLEGASAVVQTAEEMRSPVILQILPSALAVGKKPLVSLCLQMARGAEVPVAVHLDHCSNHETILYALDCGFSSVMADGSGLPFEQNISFTGNIVAAVKKRFGTATIEAELGKLSGTEDGISVNHQQASMTSPDEAVVFVENTGIDALAVCIGNIHGHYPSDPELDFDRLESIAKKVTIPLVLHGTSGLPDELILQSITMGVCKFNVNTEVRHAYLDTLKEICTTKENPELVELMQHSIESMKKPVRSKITLFKSMNKAIS
jgi:tagatose 1,6-diphosphate aldolase GatY/KbaY